MEKRIELENNRVILFSVRAQHPFRIQIHEGFLNDNNEILKDYILLMGDDYSFGGYTKDDIVKEISFEFPDAHPLYIPLIHLLNGKKELIIDDDDTLEIKKKYLRISQDDGLKIEFVNDLSNENGYERFNIFVKNIGYDLRSKIDINGKETKHLLFSFFNEVNAALMGYEKSKQLIKNKKG